MVNTLALRQPRFTDATWSFMERWITPMMTLSNGNIFRVNGPLCEGNLTKASDAEPWCFLWPAPKQTVEYSMKVSVIWDTTALNMASQKCDALRIDDIAITKQGKGQRRASWWRHQMETFSALLAICAGNSPVPGEFPAQRPVTRSFDVFFDLRLNKRLSKQPWGWWFETPVWSLWRHRNVLYGPYCNKLIGSKSVWIQPFMC